MFTDENPEIILRHTGYIYSSNKKEIPKKLLRKIKNLGIPPAYKKLWVTDNPKSDIQIVAEDANGKKQYFYKNEWRLHQNKCKNLRMYKFMKKLPIFWESLASDKLLPIGDKKRIMANMFYIIKITNIRIGNKKYKGIGLTTLRKENISIKKKNITFTFKGKSGIDHKICLDDKQIKTFLLEMKDTPGEWLFQYSATPAQPCSSKDLNSAIYMNKYYRITSNDMNDYLQSKIGKEFTCKDFRTHASNRIFMENLQKLEISNPNKNIAIAIEKTAIELGHTPSTSKKSYINEKLIEEYTKNPLRIKNGSLNTILSRHYKLQN